MKTLRLDRTLAFVSFRIALNNVSLISVSMRGAVVYPCGCCRSAWPSTVTAPRHHLALRRHPRHGDGRFRVNPTRNRSQATGGAALLQAPCP